VGYYAVKKYRYPGTPAANSTTTATPCCSVTRRVDGLKTGHTEAAGYCLVATAQARHSRMWAAVVCCRWCWALPAKTRAPTRSQKLLNWGYTAFEAVKLFDAGQPVATPPVWKGKSPTLAIGRPEAIVVAVPAGSAAQVKTQVQRPDPLVAPFTKGQAVGTLKVTLAGQPLLDVPLVALDGVEQAGVLGRAWDAVRLWIK
jgi:D-alanyl-D-alanine carboxypeptidase (penicillin-binding protein 5/6)